VVRQYERDFLAAIAICAAFALDPSRKHARDDLKDIIADLVTVHIVDLLELIDVAQDKAERLVLAHRGSDPFIKRNVERSSGEELRQLRQIVSCFQPRTTPFASPGFPLSNSYSTATPGISPWMPGISR
jgi:hypothetical protein